MNLITYKDLMLEMIQSEEKFPIDFDIAWDWAGYSRKDNAKTKLEKSFSQDADYEVLLPIQERKNEGGHNREIIKLSVKCFKQFCMLSETVKGKEVREYYIDLETEFYKPKELTRKELALMVVASENEKELLEIALKEAKPKIQYYDRIINSKSTVAIGDVAKCIGFKDMGQIKLFAFLRKHNILMSSDRGWNMPYQKYIEAGYFKTEQSSYIDQSTKLEYISYKTVVFQKGIQFIIRRLSDNGFSSENNQLRIAA